MIIIPPASVFWDCRYVPPTTSCLGVDHSKTFGDGTLCLMPWPGLRMRRVALLFFVPECPRSLHHHSGLGSRLVTAAGDLFPLPQDIAPLSAPPASGCEQGKVTIPDQSQKSKLHNRVTTASAHREALIPSWVGVPGATLAFLLLGHRWGCV